MIEMFFTFFAMWASNNPEKYSNALPVDALIPVWPGHP